MKENLNKREEFGEGGESVIERRRFVNCFVLIWSGSNSLFSFLSLILSLSLSIGWPNGNACRMRDDAAADRHCSKANRRRRRGRFRYFSLAGNKYENEPNCYFLFIIFYFKDERNNV